MSNLYLFLDEAGNFDFSPTGTKYFCLSAISCIRPFAWDSALLGLKNDLLESDLNICRFHASEDKQAVRDKVFRIIQDHISSLRIDSFIVEKRKTHPALQNIETLFPELMGFLSHYILGQLQEEVSEKVVIITDLIPVNKKRTIVEKTIKQILVSRFHGGRYSIYHHPSHSCLSLQVADYCNWAIYRKWERGDRRSYDIIKGGIKSEIEISKSQTTLYY